ncbi:MAG: dihydrolipoyl dehydrogenase [Phycisphaerae bacterium]|nr:dihydrolipoyl dehydrogenase [Phycisphaerae bacterium]
MNVNQYDLAIIGAGPGGYVAAIRAAQLGLRVACIEKESRLGGTCLRVGCIPSKALLESSEKFVQAKEHFPGHGIRVENLRIEIPDMMARKNQIVETLANGIGGLFKKNKIDRVHGTASFLTPNQLHISSSAGEHTIAATRILIATGSVPIELPGLPFDGKRVISSDQAIALEKPPQQLVVIGAGAIGLELGSVWRRLGSQVTVLELFPAVLPGADEEMARQMERALRDQGMKFHFGITAKALRQEKSRVQVVFGPADGPADKDSSIPADVVLVAVGRRATAQGLNLEKIGVTCDPRGRIVVNHKWETSIPNVYALGDVIAGPMLAHKAEEEGIAAVELICGKAGHVNYDTIPYVVYTAPELAWVGKTEAQLKEKSISYRTGKFRFAANARALCMNEAQGLVKILADAKTDRVLGVHIFGPQASSLIAEAGLAMEFGASSEDIARTCHAHPSLPEAIKEAALAVDGRMINS